MQAITKHTAPIKFKQPFRVGRNGNDVIDADGFEVCDVSDCSVLDGWDTIKGIHHWSNAPGRAFVERDEQDCYDLAKLFSAAPELLEACRAALVILENRIHASSGSPVGLARTQCRAAIRKATNA